MTVPKRFGEASSMSSADCVSSGDYFRLFRVEQDAVRYPSAIFEKMRAQSPVVWVDEISSYVVTRYEDIVSVLRDPETFSSQMATGPVLARQMADGMQAIAVQGGAEVEMALRRAGRGTTSVLLNADPPQHRRQRNLVNRAFTPRRIRESEGEIRVSAQRQVKILRERAEATGEVEFIHEFAVPYPLSVIAVRLGVPREDMAIFKRWSDDFTVAIGNHELDHDQLRTMLISQGEFFSYFERLAVARRKESADDLISELVSARLPDGEALELPELLGMLAQFLVAGNETTTKLLASCVLRLAESRELVSRLRQKPALIDRFVEETLRLDAPVQGLYRMATVDCEVGGFPIPAGSSLWLAYGSGNYDANVFTCPEQIDLEREYRKPHLAFGFGEHFCLGAALARAESSIAISLLLEQCKEFKLSNHNNLEYESSYILHGLKELWLEM